MCYGSKVRRSQANLGSQAVAKEVRNDDMDSEKCGDTFDDSICTHKKNHGGKHVDGRGTGSRWMSWTNAGKQRELAEREARRKECEESL